jgi:hypothetical protein
VVLALRDKISLYVSKMITVQVVPSDVPPRNHTAAAARLNTSVLCCGYGGGQPVVVPDVPLVDVVTGVVLLDITVDVVVGDVIVVVGTAVIVVSVVVVTAEVVSRTFTTRLLSLM